MQVIYREKVHTHTSKYTNILLYGDNQARIHIIYTHKHIYSILTYIAIYIHKTIVINTKYRNKMIK